MWLFALFVAVPLIEIALFIQVGGLIGLWPTLAIVLVTAILGTWLVRQQGALALSNVKRSFNELNDPSEPLAHGAMILFSGALLLTPGFFTDAVGFLLLVPAVRSVVFDYIRKRVKVQHFETRTTHTTYRSGPSGPRGNVIDGDYTDVTPPQGSGKPGDSGWTRH
ncbi:FxsA family protein [Psychromarinibacter sp. S121]|uniref:FxsA family protein n=1 Tax=Psychromarinibacter sp. S121 TaxID=3415127 RepID=UPI003C798B26